MNREFYCAEQGIYRDEQGFAASRRESSTTASIQSQLKSSFANFSACEITLAPLRPPNPATPWILAGLAVAGRSYPRLPRRGDSRRFDNDFRDNLAPRAQTSVSRSRGAEICIREPTSSHREALGRVAYGRKLIVDRFLEPRSRAHYACL